MRAVIVEDMPANRRLLQRLLKEHCPDVEVTAMAENVKKAVTQINETSPDLLFLDIELPDGTGFDILRQFDPVPFKVIFITGYEKYAYQAFRYHAADFLLKPIDSGELIAAVKAVTRDQPDKSYQDKIARVKQQFDDFSKLVLYDSGGFYVVETDEIIMLEANGNYTDIFLKGNKKLSFCRILKEFAELLEDRPAFMRTHRSYIINLNHVRSFTKQGMIMLTEERSAYLGDSNREEFLGYFRK